MDNIHAWYLSQEGQAIVRQCMARLSNRYMLLEIKRMPKDQRKQLREWFWERMVFLRQYDTSNPAEPRPWRTLYNRAE